MRYIVSFKSFTIDDWFIKSFNNEGHIDSWTISKEDAGHLTKVEVLAAMAHFMLRSDGDVTEVKIVKTQPV